MRGLMGLSGSVRSLIARGGLRTAAVMASSAVLLGAGLGLSADASGGPSVPRLDRVFVIMMENTSYSGPAQPGESQHDVHSELGRELRPCHALLRRDAPEPAQLRRGDQWKQLGLELG